MSKATKFGTFAGVYTPSVLTILGVIMYMRLGWVVGQSGLFTALVIILLAHVISISTGLSISSIATDKKIKTGGIYYILSRSLGLPMGGAIGISLFVGTALSISLYLIGFAESFLSIDVIREFTGLQQDINSFRIVGTAAILLLVLIAFISTSLAIKAQFYILGAIALSLVSIIIGLVINTDSAPAEPILTPFRDGLSPELIFAIFFPAVTGFTAGVAMSGDLKDSKKSIPMGTLASIGTGLVIYVGLAIGFAFFVKRDMLLNDYNFLLKIAWFSPLVIAGIWGATLSSALGGILGGPRILQAISSDRLLPKIFAKGYGSSNEPRNALILVFFIAEAGILIGELNVIAGIVTMFYLASYGFINFAFFLESWASTDFRPSFKINRYIGLIGFIAAFGVMFKLDMMSMFAALIIITLLYFFLKRKQITNDFGDVWQSVYSSLVRTALHKMDISNIEQRNWKPNIILFSGGTKKRPHLLNFGKSIVGKHGVMSNFDLIENKKAQVLFPKSKQSITEGETDKGIFTRKKTVKDIYEGVESISAVYGFSGFEPNTILLGWGRQTNNPERFVKMLNTLYELDLNVLLLDYDKKMGFGSFKTIDIWWKDVSNQGNLALTLVKFMLQSNDWHNATIRLMIINSKNDQRQSIISRAEKLLDSIRFTASIKVINNQFEQKSFHSIILEESLKTDLVIFGIPLIEEGKEAEFVEQTNKLLHKAGTVLMMRASSNFKKHSLGSETSRMTYLADKVNTKDIELAQETNIELTNIESLDTELLKLNSHLTQMFESFNKDFILPALKFNISKAILLRENFNDGLATIESPDFWQLPYAKRQKQIHSIKTNQIFKSEKLLEELQQTIKVEQKELLENGLNHLLEEFDKLPQQFPQKIMLKANDLNLEKSKFDNKSTRLKKSIKRSLHSRRKIEEGVSYPLHFREAIKRMFTQQGLENIQSSLNKMGNINLSYIIELQKLNSIINNFFDAINNPKSSIELINSSKSGVKNYFDKLDKLIASAQNKLVIELFNDVSEKVNVVGQYATSLNIPEKSKKSKYGSVKTTRKKILASPTQWTNNRFFMYNGAILELKLMVIRNRLTNLLQRSVDEIKQYTENHIVKKQAHVLKQLSKFVKDVQTDSTIDFTLKEEDLGFIDKEEFQLVLNKITDNTYKNAKAIVGRLPESTEIITTESLKEAANIMDEELRTVSMATYQLVDFYVQQNLIEPLLRNTKNLPDKMQVSNNKIKDVLRLVSMGSLGSNSLQEYDPFLEQGGESFSDNESFLIFAKEQLKIIKNESNTMENELLEVQNHLNNQLKIAAEDLSIYQLLSNPEKYKSYLSKKDKIARSSYIKSQSIKLSKSWQVLKANLWYRQSDALIFARKLSKQNIEASSLTDSLLSLKDQIAPKENVLNKIPFYYKQLFLQKQNYQREFWYNRTKELNDIDKAVSRYNKVYSGAILIRGVRKSGKTFLTNYIANSSLKGKSIFHINPPITGSTDSKVFHAALEQATMIQGSYNDIFGRISAQSVIIIDDLELWWEKTDNGTAVIQTIRKLIQQYSNKCLFILSTNGKSYHVINQLVDFDSCFLSIVDLEAFNAINLQQSIMFRHNSSGLDIAMANAPNTKLNNTKLAKLFARYFNYSNGNIGIALLAWIANIVDVKENKILIKTPLSPDSFALNNLNAQQKVYLTLMVLHNRVSIEKLVRLTHDSKDKVDEDILFLKRSGLVKEYTGHVYEIDPYLHPFINKVLFEKELR
ncbi:MAG: amino acid permease [Bacteroidetes bacterium]|nr:amino acid permease [Bacteroidota bacterium]